MFRGHIVNKDILVTVDVCSPGEGAAIGRKIAGAGFPFLLRQPLYFFGGDVKQPDVVVSIAGIGGDEQLPAIGRPVGGGINFFTTVPGQVLAVSASQLDYINVGVFAGGIAIGIGDPLAIARPQWIDLVALFGFTM